MKLSEIKSLEEQNLDSLHREKDRLQSNIGTPGEGRNTRRDLQNVHQQIKDAGGQKKVKVAKPSEQQLKDEHTAGRKRYQDWVKSKIS